MGDATVVILHVFINLPSIYTSTARLYTLTDIFTQVCNGKFVTLHVDESELYTLSSLPTALGLSGSIYIFKSLVVFEKYKAKKHGLFVPGATAKIFLLFP